MDSEEREYLLADVANMYYRENKTQAKIAKALDCSRSLVSLMLKEAIEKGIVKVEIQYPIKRAPLLEHKLKEQFGLQEAFVINRGDLNYAHMLRLIGRTTAAYLQNHLPEKGILGIGWGAAVFEVVNALKPTPLPEMKVVQLCGAVSLSDRLMDGPELARSLAHKFSTEYYTLNAPAIVAHTHIRQALIEEKQIREVLALASRMDVALIGIGTTNPELSSMLRTGYLTIEEIKQLEAQGGVGDVCGYHYNIQGKLLALDINQRVVGIDLSVIRNGSCKVVAVAGGQQKSTAILGALRGGFVDILTTDDVTVEHMLSLSLQPEANGL